MNRSAYPWLGRSVLLLWLLITTLGISCYWGKPKVSLKVEPKIVCPGGAVGVEWKTSGFDDVTLTSDPEVYYTKKKDGTEVVAITEDTTFTVEGKKSGSSAKDEVFVTVVPPGGGSTSINASPDCSTGQPNWSGTKIPEDWGAQIEITSVQNTSDRPVTITFNGKNETVPDGGFSNNWNGDSPGGTWTLWAPLKTDSLSDPFGGHYEACSPSSATGGPEALQWKAPPVLRIVINYGCP